MTHPARVDALRAWTEAALSFFYPDLCQICGVHSAGKANGYVCSDCREGPQGVRLIKPPYCERCGLPFPGDITHAFDCSNCREMKLHFTQARAAVTATELLLEVVHRYKYQRALWFEPFLADLLIQTAAPELSEAPVDLLIPVPLHPLKEKEREFNQAARLAERLSRATGIPCAQNCLKRVRATDTQTRLSRDDRARNMKRAFAASGTTVVAGRRIALIDDVLTTGATTSSCALALRQAGARDVIVWTVTRGL
jgi:competence protein ComFC